VSEDFKIFLEDLKDYLNGQEASLVKLKMQIEKILGDARPSKKLPFDVSKIQWQDRQGQKGKFQLSEDYDSLDHKALLKYLNERGGCCQTSEGWFYWVYPNGSTIARKLRKAAHG